jgi:D-amino-acid oxidase
MKAAEGAREIAVLGAGAIGLTSATLLQRAGVQVRIYAREFSLYTRSSRATGSRTPDSRVALASAVTSDFPALWETMARASFFYHQSYYGMPGPPVEWTDRWNLSDHPRIIGPDGTVQRTDRPIPEHDFIHLNPPIADLAPQPIVMSPGSTPFRYQ